MGGDFFPDEFHKISVECIYKKNRKRTHMNIFIFLKSKIEKWDLEPGTSADGTPGPGSGSPKFISWTRDPKHSKREPGPRTQKYWSEIQGAGPKKGVLRPSTPKYLKGTWHLWFPIVFIVYSTLYTLHFLYFTLRFLYTLLQKFALICL